MLSKLRNIISEYLQKKRLRKFKEPTKNFYHWFTKHKKKCFATIVIVALVFIFRVNIFILLGIINDFRKGSIYITYDDMPHIISVTVTGIFSFLLWKVSRQQMIHTKLTQLNDKIGFIEREIDLIRLCEEKTTELIETIKNNILIYQKEADSKVDIKFWINEINNVKDTINNIESNDIRGTDTSTLFFMKKDILNRVQDIDKIINNMNTMIKVNKATKIHLLNEMLEQLETLTRLLKIYDVELLEVFIKLYDKTSLYE